MLLSALLTATLLTPPPIQVRPSDEPIVEKRTEIAFDRTRTIPAEKDVPGAKPTTVALAGIGVRDKYFLNVKVYAFGLYMEPVGARKTLAPWIGKSAKEMSKDKKFSKAACSDGFVKSLRLVFYRDVDGEDVAEAFDDSLEPRIKEAVKNKKMQDAAKELTTFRAIFDKGEIKENDEIIFDFFPKGRIDVYLRGKFMGRFDSPALSWALQDVYLGMDSIEDNEEKAKMIGRLPQTLLAPPQEAQEDK